MILSEGEQINFDSVIEENKKQRVFLRFKEYLSDNKLILKRSIGLQNCHQPVRTAGGMNNTRYFISSTVINIKDPVKRQFFEEIVKPLLDSNLVHNSYSIGPTGILRVTLFDKPTYRNLKMFFVVNVIRAIGRITTNRLTDIIVFNKELADIDPKLSLVSRYQIITTKYWDFINSRDLQGIPKLVNQNKVESLFKDNNTHLFSALQYINNNGIHTYAVATTNATDLYNLVKQNQ